MPVRASYKHVARTVVRSGDAGGQSGGRQSHKQIAWSVVEALLTERLALLPPDVLEGPVKIPRQQLGDPVFEPCLGAIRKRKVVGMRADSQRRLSEGASGYRKTHRPKE